MADQPVIITVATTWRFQLDAPPPRPPRMTVAEAIISTVLCVTRLVFGAVYFNDCPQQPNIPSYLLGLSLAALLMIPFVTFPCESYAAHPRELPRGLKACLQGLIGLFFLTWNLAGAVWVFSVYQPNYDPAAASLFCDKTLYTFAFWNAVLEMFSLGVPLANLCKGVLCVILMSPVPVHRVPSV